MKFLFPSILSLLLLACSTPDNGTSNNTRYIFPELESVDRIFNYNQTSWESIDNQSLIIVSAPSTYYLLVLNAPLPQLENAMAIDVSKTSGRVQKGFDTVSTARNRSVRSAIQEIYKLEGKNQVEDVREQILAE